MKKFKLGFKSYIFAILSIVILVPTLLWKELGFGRYILCCPLIILQCFNIVNAMFFIRTSVDDKGIGNIKNFIEWDEIDCVYTNDGSYIYKHWVTIRSGSKKINVTSWFKDYKELIKIVVDECKKRNIKVELMVEKIIED
jgi:hypothetical protein